MTEEKTMPKPDFIPPTSPTVVAPQKKERQPYTATGIDALFAAVCFCLAAVMHNFMLTYYSWEGWGTGLFVGLYISTLLLYAKKQKITPTKYSWYWLGILAALGVASSLWPSGSLVVYRELMLYAVAVYWCGTLFNVGLEGKTGNYLLLDALNLMLVVPFQNLGLAWRSLAIPLLGKLKARDAEGKKHRGRRVGAVLLGLVLCIPVALVVLPMLLRADSGGFTKLIIRFFDVLNDILRNLNLQSFWDILVIFFVGCYLFGLVAGSAHRRYVTQIDVKKTQKSLEGLRLLPGASTAALLGAITLLYAVFMGSQLPYFFSAFGGTLPENYVNYAQYARDGFFELCRISVINLLLLLCANCASRTPRAVSKILRGMNIALSGVTLLLLATAFSKMALYIGAYGYTPKRILTSVFMVWMAVVWGGVILLQFRSFSVLRLAAVAGSLLFSLLCLVGIDRPVSTANARLYLEGKIPTYETVLLHNGIDYNAVLAVRESMGEDERLQRQYLKEALEGSVRAAERAWGTPRDTLTHLLVRRASNSEEEAGL